MTPVPYFSRNFSITDFTAVASVIGTARNAASAPRASIRIDGFLRTFLYHSVSEPRTGSRYSVSSSATEPDRIRERLPSFSADYA
jgi:hypothetical protein